MTAAENIDKPAEVSMLQHVFIDKPAEVSMSRDVCIDKLAKVSIPWRQKPLLRLKAHNSLPKS